MAQNTTHLVLDALGALEAQPAAVDEMLALLQQWQTYFAELFAPPPPLSALVLTMLAAPTRAQKLDLIRQAAENPLIGLSLVIATAPGTFNRQVARWWEMLSFEQAANGTIPGWDVKTLPAPATGGPKYLIISDLHRDAASDDRGPLASDSIDHFKGNAALYERILDFAYNGGYTLLEGGDCEELWFVRRVPDYPKKGDGTLDVAAKLQEIMNSHPQVYDKLRRLHRANRYYRIYGNHDSFLKPAGADDSIFRVLRTFMEQLPAGVSAAPVPFKIFDAFIIDGVKSMTEQSAFDLLLDAIKLKRGQMTKEQYVASLLKGRLGLDSNDYTDKRKMIVTHGHQFDVWNSPGNEILGMLIANTVGTFIDRHMDPFLDCRGVALGGNPLFEFEDLFARLPVFDSWPARQSAVRFAHEVQHKPNRERVLNDSIMFSESIAAIYGTFCIGLNWVDANGNEVTAAQSRSAPGFDVTDPMQLAEYYSRHYMHHLCIGHTHNPHSQPGFTLKNLGFVAPPLWPVTTLLRILLPSFLEPQVKTMYFNSGTAGWMEGVIWGIEIGQDGQARLVFWTDNSVGPEYMDWELQPMPSAIKNNLLAGLSAAFLKPITELQDSVEDIYTSVKNRLVALGMAPAAVTAAMVRAVSIPIHALVVGLMSSAPARGLRHLKEVPRGVQRRLDGLRREIEELRGFTFEVIFTMKRRALQGFTAGEWDQLVIRAPIPASARSRLDRFKRIIKTTGLTDDAALHYAGMLLASFDEFPRNLPFFSTMAEPLNPEVRLEESDTPVLHALLGTLWMYPPKGENVRVGDVVLRSEFAVAGDEVSLTVRIEKYVATLPPVA